MNWKDLPEDDKPQINAKATNHEMLFEELKRRTRFEEPCCDACMQERYEIIHELRRQANLLDKKVREQECRENVRRIADTKFKEIEKDRTPKIQLPPPELVDEMRIHADKSMFVNPDLLGYGGITRSSTRNVKTEWIIEHDTTNLKDIVAEATAAESDAMFPDWRNDPQKVAMFKRLFGYLPPKREE